MIAIIINLGKYVRRNKQSNKNEWVTRRDTIIQSNVATQINGIFFFTNSAKMSVNGTRISKSGEFIHFVFHLNWKIRLRTKERNYCFMTNITLNVLWKNQQFSDVIFFSLNPRKKNNFNFLLNLVLTRKNQIMRYIVIKFWQ